MTLHIPAEDRASANAPQTTSGPAGAEIDLAALAERVFRLIKRNEIGRASCRERV